MMVKDDLECIDFNRLEYFITKMTLGQARYWLTLAIFLNTIFVINSKLWITSV